MKKRCINCGWFHNNAANVCKGKCHINPCERRGLTPPCDFYIPRQQQFRVEANALR